MVFSSPLFTAAWSLSLLQLHWSVLPLPLFRFQSTRNRLHLSQIVGRWGLWSSLSIPSFCSIVIRDQAELIRPAQTHIQHTGYAPVPQKANRRCNRIGILFRLLSLEANFLQYLCQSFVGYDLAKTVSLVRWGVRILGCPTDTKIVVSICGLNETLSFMTITRLLGAHTSDRDQIYG